MRDSVFCLVPAGDNEVRHLFSTPLHFHHCTSTQVPHTTVRTPSLCPSHYRTHIIHALPRLVRAFTLPSPTAAYLSSSQTSCLARLPQRYARSLIKSLPMGSARGICPWDLPVGSCPWDPTLGSCPASPAIPASYSRLVTTLRCCTLSCGCVWKRLHFELPRCNCCPNFERSRMTRLLCVGRRSFGMARTFFTLLAVSLLPALLPLLPAGPRPTFCSPPRMVVCRLTPHADGQRHHPTSSPNPNPMLHPHTQAGHRHASSRRLPTRPQVRS